MAQQEPPNSNRPDRWNKPEQQSLERSFAQQRKPSRYEEEQEWRTLREQPQARAQTGEQEPGRWLAGHAGLAEREE